MNGVEILNAETIYNTILPEWCMGFGLFSGFLFIAIMAILFAQDRIFLGTLCIALTISSAVIAILGGTDSKTDIDYIEYKVTINDSVSMNEFLDKYEILDQEGKIYTVKEIE